MSMSYAEAQAFADLRAEVARLRREMELRPIRVPLTASNTFRVIVIDQGNILDDGSTKGCKYVTPQITSVPSAYNPNTQTSFIDGIARGTLYVNGAAQTGYVLLVNDGRGDSAVSFALVTQDSVVVGPALSIPVSGGSGAVTVYAPIFA